MSERKMLNTNLTSKKKAVFPHHWLIKKNPYLWSPFTLLIFNYVIQWWVIKYITLICIQVNQIYLAFSQSAYFDRIVKHSPCTYIRALMGKHTLITAWRTIVIIHAVMVVIIIPSLTNAQGVKAQLGPDGTKL